MSKKPSTKRLDITLRSDEEKELDAGMRHRVVGQEAAIETLVDAYALWKAKLNPPEHPIANLMFLGPPGSGKTLVLEALGEEIFGTASVVRKVHCEEFQHSHEIAKLTGSPPGYLGHRETKPFLSQENLDEFHTEDHKLTLLLFDEIEKASDALWSLLLGILDKARLTLGDNRLVSFEKCIIALTGNLGGKEIAFLQQGGLGFAATTLGDDQLDSKTDKAALEAAKRRFTPEFLDRIDKTVVFHALRPEQLRQVVDIELEKVQSRVLKMVDSRQFIINYTQGAKELLLEKGTSKKYGARPLQKTIQDMLVKRLSRLVTTNQVKFGDLIMVDAEDRDLVFSRTGQGIISPFDISEIASDIADAATA